MKIIFDVAHLYYLPQYLSVYKILADKKVDCLFVVYRNKDLIQIIENEIKQLKLKFNFFFFLSLRFIFFGLFALFFLFKNKLIK